VPVSTGFKPRVGPVQLGIIQLKDFGNSVDRSDVGSKAMNGSGWSEALDFVDRDIPKE